MAVDIGLDADPAGARHSPTIFIPSCVPTDESHKKYKTCAFVKVHWIWLGRMEQRYFIAHKYNEHASKLECGILCSVGWATPIEILDVVPWSSVARICIIYLRVMEPFSLYPYGILTISTYPAWSLSQLYPVRWFIRRRHEDVSGRSLSSHKMAFVIIDYVAVNMSPGSPALLPGYPIFKELLMYLL